ncbi:MAG: MMPL family transporter [Thermoleophilia bacterium]|nr:MMPL family transporter [Thermoleophilia bacterium]
MRRLAGWSIRHRVLAIVLWIVLVAGAVAGGGIAGTRMLTEGESGSGQSARADRALEHSAFPADLTERVLIRDPAGGVLQPATARAAAARLRAAYGGMPEVASVGPLAFSDGGRAAVLPVVLDTGAATGEAAETLATDRVGAVLEATARVASADPGVRIGQVGDASVSRAVDAAISDDFSRAELLSLPVTLGILLLAFGALFAAGVPVLLALSAVAGALGLTAMVSQVLPVSEAVSSVVLLIGMAVGVDYSLFYVRRAREERARGAGARAALDVAAATSGRAVVVSGLAVIVAMAGLLLSGNAVFTSMAIGTILVVAVAVTGSLTVLPAVLSLIGDRIDRPRIPLLHRLSRPGRRRRLWPAVMRVVLARPKASLAVAAGALALLAAPALGMTLGESGADSLPRDIPELQTYDALTAAFPQNGFAHDVVLWADRSMDRDALQTAAARLRREAAASGLFADAGAAELRLAPDARTAAIDLPYEGDYTGTAADRSLDLLRGELVPEMAAAVPGAHAGVAGETAGSRDFADVMRGRLPLVIGFVLAVTFLVLVAAFRSVVVAATAVLLNLLSVGAAYGLLVLVFQHGFGAGLIGASHTGFIVDWLPLFLFVVLFGLSMDYHVFVVSRIREAHDAGVPTRLAVARGVTSSAGVVTSAAAVMVGVFAIFGTLSLVEFKQMGVGLAAAILIDATVVRAVLLPAAMTVLGRRNWWMPARLARLLPAAH